MPVGFFSLVCVHTRIDQFGCVLWWNTLCRGRCAIWHTTLGGNARSAESILSRLNGPYVSVQRVVGMRTEVKGVFDVMRLLVLGDRIEKFDIISKSYWISICRNIGFGYKVHTPCIALRHVVLYRFSTDRTELRKITSNFDITSFLSISITMCSWTRCDEYYARHLWWW